VAEGIQDSAIVPCCELHSPQGPPKKIQVICKETPDKRRSQYMELKTGSFYEYGSFRLEPAEHRLTRDGKPVSLAPKTFELLVFLVQNQGRLVTKDQIMQAVWPGSFVEDANLTVTISVLRKALGEKDGDLRYIETVPKKGYRFTASVKEVANFPEQLLEFGEELLEQPLIPSNDAASPAVLAPQSAEENENHIQIRGQIRDGPALILPKAARPQSRRWMRTLAVAALASIVLATGYFAIRRRMSSLAQTPLHRSVAILPLRNLSQNPNDDFLGFSLADA
jgi:DNA-binding winged helix-turn-helix (wHTH) protein